MITLFLSTMALLLAWTSPALAVQAHGDPEGLFSHQLGHLLFTIGMGYLLFRVHRATLQTPGWRQFRVFLWLIILWNVQTFTGHWLHEYMGPDRFVRAGGHIVAFQANTPLDWYFYFTRFDHLLLVSAFLFLLLALNNWRAAS